MTAVSGALAQKALTQIALAQEALKSKQQADQALANLVADSVDTQAAINGSRGSIVNILV